MHTLTGYPLTVGHGRDVPSLRDVAIVLARVPRWNGMTIRPWNVLQHSLTALMIANELKEAPEVQLACALHDIEESLTSDIARPVKTDAQRAKGEEIRKWLYRYTVKLPYPNAATLGRVTVIDNDLQAGEMHTLCHPRIRASFRECQNLLFTADVIFDLIGLTENELVSMFLRATDELLAIPSIATTRSNA